MTPGDAGEKVAEEPREGIVQSTARILEQGRLSPPELIEPGRMAIVIDGQFGSTGKGLASSWVGLAAHVDVALTNASPNAGHTFIDPDGRKRVAKHLPVAGILNKRSTKYLCAGSIIHPETFLREIDQLGLDPTTVFVHPRAAVITPDCVDAEREGGGPVDRIGSTGQGAGEALARKVRRVGMIASDCPALRSFVAEIDVAELLDEGVSALMEVPQGFDLSINSGLAYPYCTSREITVEQALADAQVHPRLLGKVLMVVRAHPIRVGNPLGDDGRETGWSGPFWPDSQETDWDTLGVEAERTTVTGRVRRVASFSMEQYRNACRRVRPDLCLLNFANYARTGAELRRWLSKAGEVLPVTHVGLGPHFDDVVAAKAAWQAAGLVGRGDLRSVLSEALALSKDQETPVPAPCT